MTLRRPLLCQPVLLDDVRPSSGGWPRRELPPVSRTPGFGADRRAMDLIRINGSPLRLLGVAIQNPCTDRTRPHLASVTWTRAQLRVRRDVVRPLITASRR